MKEMRYEVTIKIITSDKIKDLDYTMMLNEANTHSKVLQVAREVLDNDIQEELSDLIGSSEYKEISILDSKFEINDVVEGEQC